MSNILIILSIMLIILSSSSLIYNIKHLGVFIPTIIGAVILIIELISKYFNYNILFLEILFLTFYILLIIAICICNFTYLRPQEYNYQNNTLIILGCRIRNNQPSRMLKKRLDKAIELLNKYPNLKCVVSGGQGKDEDFTESYIMKQYLINNGINKERIYEESKSTNTFSNLEYSKKVIISNNLYNDIIILSDSYHLFRASEYAKKLDIECTCIPCKTNPVLWFSYMFRELLGLCVYYIKYKK